jgi:heme/copper-type cytochrome/quinol oxidase subunit 4
MIRFVALDAIFFLLPFAAYALWLVISRRTMTNAADWQVRTIAWLTLAGATLMTVALVVFIHLDTTPPGGTYVPAHVEDGQIVPGQIIPEGNRPPG